MQPADSMASITFLRTTGARLFNTRNVSRLALLLIPLLARGITASGPRGDQKPEGRPTDSTAAIAAHASELIQQGKIADALARVAVLQKRGSSDPEAEFAAGEILQELAALRAEQLQQAAPDSSEAHELLGKSFEAQGKLEKALVQYRQARGKAYARPGLAFLIGNVEWKLRNFGEAQRELGDELKVNPHHAMANLRTGQILLETRRDTPEKAIEYLEEAARGAPASLEVHRELGKALRLAHRYREAEKELGTVAARAPNDPAVHAQLAALYKDMGESAKSREQIALHAKILRERLEASRKEHVPQSP
jgi:tetratricopeptide (TPR) repeat protein